MTTSTDLHRVTRPVDVGTVVVGAGQAGLVISYYLDRAGEDFVVLEADARIGDVWRRRYDSLRLFSTPRYASLPGRRIPLRTYPSRDEFADYLEQYAAHFGFPIRTGTRVARISRDGAGFLVQTTAGDVRARRVVVTTGEHHRPRVPAFASELDPAIRQLHSIDYRNPAQFAPGGVLVVGAANSGTDVALDAAAAGHPVWLAGRHPGQVPVDIDTARARPVIPIVMFVFKHLLTLRTPMGRSAREQARHHGAPLVRNKIADLDAAGVRRIGRITAVHGGRPVADDGTAPDVSTVVWCTGSGQDHSFLDLPVAGPDGQLLHERGVAAEPGLYFLGLGFQYALASGTIQGLDRDARYLLRSMRRDRSRRPAREPQAEAVA
jgi:putative flavoprotein involved in K+ transport